MPNPKPLDEPEGIKEVNERINSGKRTLLMLSSGTCLPCQATKLMIEGKEEFRSDLDQRGVKLLYLNLLKNGTYQVLHKNHGLKHVLAFVAYRGVKKRETLDNGCPTIRQIRTLIEKSFSPYEPDDLQTQAYGFS